MKSCKCIKVVDKQKRAYLELHLAVLLFGFTAILGDLMDLPAIVIVWWRLLITSISFIFIIKSIRHLGSFSKNQILRFMGIGIITSLHWVLFFAAIQYSNASITLVALACTSFFVSLVEPIIMKRKFEWIEVVIGLIIVPAMILIVNNIEDGYVIGVFLGLLSAFLAAIFTSLNKKYIVDGKERIISFLELGGAWIFLSLLLPIYHMWQPIEAFWPSNMDWVYLLILALLCTTLAYVMAMKALNYISAFASALTINLEPVYGIFLAVFLLKEHKELNLEFYLGVVIIIAAVTIYPLLMRRRKRKLI
ncbi:DMT family transporter [Portibacter lacus]|nr:EamA family transporter [Portibacter lacus]